MYEQRGLDHMLCSMGCCVFGRNSDRHGHRKGKWWRRDAEQKAAKCDETVRDRVLQAAMTPIASLQRGHFAGLICSRSFTLLCVPMFSPMQRSVPAPPLSASTSIQRVSSPWVLAKLVRHFWIMSALVSMLHCALVSLFESTLQGSSSAKRRLHMLRLRF